MIRLIFFLGAALAMAVLLVVLAMIGFTAWPPPLLIAVLIGLSAGCVVLSSVGYERWIDSHRPAEDLTRLKVYLEASEARVLAIQPAGVQVVGRNGPDWRKYLARVRLADGQEVDRNVGVEVTLLARPTVRDYDHPHRIDYRIT